MTELDMMGIHGSTSGTDEMDASELANLPIEELADKPIENLVQLPTELLAKLLAEMPSEKGARLLSELPDSQRRAVLSAFARIAMSRLVEDGDSEDALDDDQEDEDDFYSDDDEDESDDDEDEDSEDEDEDEEPGDDDEEDDSEDEEDEETPSTQHRKGSSAPVGKRVILRRDYKSNAAYCEAVVKSMHAVLRKLGIRTEVHSFRPGVKVFAFDKTTSGVDIDCFIVCEFNRCNYRIEFKFNVDNQPGRTPIIDYFCQDKNFPMCYGALIMDQNGIAKKGLKKLEYSSCFYGAFSEEAFATYFDLLNSSLKAYAADYAKIAGEKKLDADQRKVVKSMLGDLCACLPARVKPENEEKLAAVAEILGGHLKPSQKKLLNYIAEHVK